MAEKNTPDEDYLKSLNGAEWFVVLARGAFGFRYGPYTGEEVGKIMGQCVDEGIPCFVTANCGREFDWDVARDFARGEPADWRPMSEAPKDGTEIIGDVNGVETLMIWWISWEWWREALPNNECGKPVTPMRWRHATTTEGNGEHA